MDRGIFAASAGMAVDAAPAAWVAAMRWPHPRPDRPGRTSAPRRRAGLNGTAARICGRKQPEAPDLPVAASNRAIEPGGEAATSGGRGAEIPDVSMADLDTYFAARDARREGRAGPARITPD